ncbi:hypothetical protein ACFY0G_17430 [Streptomyces sp. NPDC001552]|uniref:hypothetical protein n=1 Tax=Streptomyces sp. NPDC001552 TaxID=3364587 RepID=UPI003689BB2E
MITDPIRATGPEASARLHFTDPRIAALSKTAHATSPDDTRAWHELDWAEQHVWRTAARDWLRVAVAVGLLPLVEPSTGDALAAVPLDVRPGDGRPRRGSRGRAAVFREAAHAVRADAFAWGGPDHEDAWTAAHGRLVELAREAEGAAGVSSGPEHTAAALARVRAWAALLDDEAQRATGRLAASDPTADVLRSLLDGTRHGEDPL